MSEPGLSETEIFNRLLDRLHELFPYHDIQLLRDKLIHCNAETKLHVVTESLLHAKIAPPPPRVGRMEAWERFRDADYQGAVRKVLRKEFKGLASSTIKAVLAENNFDYLRCRKTLFEISTKSWRYAVSSWWFRRKTIKASIETSPEPTGCIELDREIFLLGAPRRDEATAQDEDLARKLNEQDYEAAGALVECQCCFGDYAWEDVVACTESHIFCRGCLLSAVKEGLYGQGNNLCLDYCSISCISSTADPPCQAAVSEQVLEIALPQDMLQSLRNRVTDENLANSGLCLVRCPFCTYAEVEEVFRYRIKRSALSLMVWALCFGACILPIIFFLPFLACFVFLYKIPLKHNISAMAQKRLDKTVGNIQRNARGQMFTCQNIAVCGKRSCRDCGKEWLPFHKCFEQEEDSMRLFVERAMADAVKRTCPVCSISFVKSDGCNKLTCVCGYVMCYLCRADIKLVGYQHFCQHFRQLPGTACTECDKCDLYVQEDEARKIQAAAKKAEKEYLQTHKSTSGWSPSQGRVIGDVRLGSSDIKVADHLLAQIQWPSSLDGLIESILERILEWDSA